MKTFTPKAGEIEKKWYIVDAKDKVLGKLATKVANALRGKNNPKFAPHIDCGGFVIVVNCDKVKLTGNKLEGKMYYKHSGFPGALTEISAGDLLAKKPTKVIELAISGMLPKNKLRPVMMKKLHLFAGEEHPHSAQTPTKLEI
ncbi:MAG: 50S ribosomal protein L13 [Candidatus Gracilibacteria bacterium]|nr:50S ribosomal protein L13 [Candidatus Gracilibacteria bacterium]